MKIGIVDVGGGLRGIYAAGIFDYCLDNDITFDLGIGVSAGSANVASFIAKQRGRNYTFYTEYIFRKKYMSFRNFVLKRSYVDMDYVYGTLSNKNGENPLNYKKMQENPMDFTIVAMDATTGNPVYFNKTNISQDHYDVFKASSSLPFICKPYFIDNIPYYDGGVGDPIPLQKAFDEGCDKVIIILTKPKDFIRNSRQDTRISKFIERKYPNSARKLRKRADNYNKTLKLAKKYEKENKVLIIAPDSTCGVKTLTKDLNALNILYKKGYRDAEKIKEFIK